MLWSSMHPYNRDPGYACPDCPDCGEWEGELVDEHRDYDDGGDGPGCEYTVRVYECPDPDCKHTWEVESKS